MIEEFLYRNGDIHSLTATKVFSLIRGEKVEVSSTVNTDLRYIAKTVNFGSLYGIGAYKLAKNLSIDPELAEQILESFYLTYPKLDAYFKKGHKDVLNSGYVLIDNVTGRKSWFAFYDEYLHLKSIVEDYKERQYVAKREGTTIKPLPKDVWSDFFTLKGIMERASQNYKIQGGAASMTKVAMILMYNYLLENNLFDKASIILALHDEIVLEADESIAEEINSKLNEFMLEAGKIFCKSIPMKSDGGPSALWEH